MFGRRKPRPTANPYQPAGDPVRGKLGLTGDPFPLCTDLYDLADNQRTGWQILSGPGNPMITVFDPYQNGVTYSLDLRTVPPGRWVRVPAGAQPVRVPVEVCRTPGAFLARWCDEDDQAARS
jgi:hypothetical protein